MMKINLPIKKSSLINKYDLSAPFVLANGLRVTIIYFGDWTSPESNLLGQEWRDVKTSHALLSTIKS